MRSGVMPPSCKFLQRPLSSKRAVSVTAHHRPSTKGSTRMRKLARIFVPGHARGESSPPCGGSDSSTAPRPRWRRVGERVGRTVRLRLHGRPRAGRRRPGHLDRRAQARRRPGGGRRVRRGQRHLRRGPGDLHRPPDQLRHRQRGRQRPRRRRRRARLDRQPGAERRHRAAADLDARPAVGLLRRRPSRRRRTTASSTACPTASRRSRSTATPTWRPTSPRPSTTPSTPARRRSRTARSSRRSTCPSASIGDAYHMEPILTSFGGYIFGTRAPTAATTPSDVGIGKEGSHRGRPRRSPSWPRRRCCAPRSAATTRSRCSPRARRRSWSPARGRCPTSRRPASSTPSSRSPASRARARPQPFMGAQAFMVASGAKNAAFAQEFVTNGVNNEEAMMTLFDAAPSCLRP